MRRFVLDRKVDVTGSSGVGIVAQGVVFDDGVAVVRWLTEWPSSVVWHDRGEASLHEIHAHGGHTQIVFLDDEDGHEIVRAHDEEQ